MNSQITQETFQEVKRNFLMVLVCTAVLILQLIMFLFYAYLINHNHESDQRMPIYPFIQHTFRIVCLSQFMNFFLAIIVLPCYIAAFLKPDLLLQTNVKITAAFLIGVVLITAVITTITTFISNLLTILLAYYRLILMFFPKVGEFLCPDKPTMNVVVGFFGLFGSFLVLQCLIKQNQSCLVILVVIRVSEVLVSLPYFLMIRKIRSLTHLRSVITAQPEKHIAYQIFITNCVKFILFGILVYFKFREGYSYSLIAQAFLIDEALFLPLSTQSAYILSKKSNLEALKKLFRKMKSFWKKGLSTVGPDENTNGSVEVNCATTA